MLTAPPGKILVIEDEKRLRTNLQLLLASEGYTVCTAADGQAGIDLLHQEAFDLIITDIMMGEVNGFQVMEYVATRAPETLVIVITGNASTESAVEALRKGAYDYIAKPFEIEMITIAVGRAMERVRLQGELRQHAIDMATTNQKLQRSLDELQATQERLLQTEKLSALGALIADLAQKLHGPLGNITAYGDTLVASPDTPSEVRFLLTKSHHEALQCQQIVQNLLSFARPHKLQTSYLDVNTLCRQALDLLAYECKMHHIQVSAQLDASVPWTLVDATQFQQVLVHILRNASQAMADYQGSGHLTVKTTCDPTHLYVQVTDTGPGIAAAQLSHIFDPFYTTKRHGVGLGLSLSYGLMQAHGGDITVASAPGEGTTVTLMLPIRQEAVPGEVVRLPPQQAALPAKKALVIDAERNTAQTALMLLRSLGYQADTVDTGPAALQHMAAQVYDVILCDLHVPGSDGRPVAQLLKDVHPDVLPRCVFTHEADLNEATQRLVQDTGRPVLRKPFLLKEFKQAVPR